MKQITIRELRRSATEEMLREACEITSDGRVVAYIHPIGQPDLRTAGDVAQIEVPLPPSVAHLVKHGDEVPQLETKRPSVVAQRGVLPYDKKLQATRQGFNG